MSLLFIYPIVIKNKNDLFTITGVKGSSSFERLKYSELEKKYSNSLVVNCNPTNSLHRFGFIKAMPVISLRGVSGITEPTVASIREAMEEVSSEKNPKMVDKVQNNGPVGSHTLLYLTKTKNGTIIVLDQTGRVGSVESIGVGLLASYRCVFVSDLEKSECPTILKKYVYFTDKAKYVYKRILNNGRALIKHSIDEKEIEPINSVEFFNISKWALYSIAHQYISYMDGRNINYTAGAVEEFINLFEQENEEFVISSHINDISIKDIIEDDQLVGSNKVDTESKTELSKKDLEDISHSIYNDEETGEVIFTRHSDDESEFHRKSKPKTLEEILSSSSIKTESEKRMEDIHREEEEEQLIRKRNARNREERIELGKSEDIPDPSIEDFDEIPKLRKAISYLNDKYPREMVNYILIECDKYHTRSSTDVSIVITASELSKIKRDTEAKIFETKYQTVHIYQDRFTSFLRKIYKIPKKSSGANLFMNFEQPILKDIRDTVVNFGVIENIYFKMFSLLKTISFHHSTYNNKEHMNTDIKQIVCYNRIGLFNTVLFKERITAYDKLYDEKGELNDRGLLACKIAYSLLILLTYGVKAVHISQLRRQVALICDHSVTSSDINKIIYQDPITFRDNGNALWSLNPNIFNLSDYSADDLYNYRFP